MILDIGVYKASLPASIEAVYVITTPHYAAKADGRNCSDARNCGNKCDAYARTFHARLHEHFGERAAGIPLLGLDVFDWRAPFSVLRPAADARASRREGVRHAGASAARVRTGGGLS